MSFRLDQLLKASTVRVSTNGRAYEGMGFFFAPGLALTSAHVVTQAEGEMVQVFLPGEGHAIPAEVKYRFPDDVGLVILQVQTAEALPCAYLDSDIKPGDKGYTFGCTGTSRKTQRIMLECEGLMDSAIGIAHLAGRSKQLRINGSPILNQRTGKVCGIVHAPKNGEPYRGEAVPMGVIFSEFPALSILQKEYHCQDSRWSTLLHPDLEALNGDWTYYNRGWIRREQSIRALMFLLRTASQWALIGARMRHVFPWRSIISLIKQTFRGQLGTEIQRQYHYITRQIASQIDPHSGGQARALHRIDAQSWVISSLMEMLISPEQDYASSSRLLWMLEILQEQRVYIQTMKRLPGNFYPQLENFKRRWKLLEHDEKYIDTSRVLSGLINRHTDTNFSLWYTIKFFLKDFILDLSQNSKLSAHGLERLFNMLVVNLRHAVPTPTASVEDLLRDLEEEVRQNPDLKVLQKVQILMTSVSGELVQGGTYRALKGSSTYHFSNKCKLYPERAKAEELARIICYETEAEAQQHHKPCKNCLNAEKLLDRRLSDWHDGEPTTIQAAETVPANDEALSDESATAESTSSEILGETLGDSPELLPPLTANNLAILSVSQTDSETAEPVIATSAATDVAPQIQVPVTELAIAQAPAADAPLPEAITAIVETPEVVTVLQTEETEETGATDQPISPTSVDAKNIIEAIAVTTQVSVDEPSASAPPIEVTEGATSDVVGPIAQTSTVDADHTETVEPDATSTDMTATSDKDEVAATPSEITTESESLEEPEHDIDIEGISAQVEVEIAAAIAEVALEIAEASQAAPTETAETSATASPEAATTPEVNATTELPAVDLTTQTTIAQDESAIAPVETEAAGSEADLLELNTEAYDDEDDVAEMALFFVPDGDQPAINLNATPSISETQASEPSEASSSRKHTAKTKTTKTTTTTTTKAAPKKSTKRKKSTRSRKQPKTLKDFVSSISSASKNLDLGDGPKADQATATAQSKPTKTSTSKTSTQQRSRKAPVVAKATPQTSKSVKVSSTETKTRKATKTATAKKRTTKQSSEPKITSPTTPVASKSKEHQTTQSKAKKNAKVARLADWATPDDGAASEKTEGSIVSITAAKSARSKRGNRTKAKRTTQKHDR